MIGKVKTPAAKDKYKKQQREYVREFRKHASNLGNIVLFQNLMIDAKMQIVRKLNSVKGLTDTFIRTANGYKVTNPDVRLRRYLENLLKDYAASAKSSKFSTSSFAFKKLSVFTVTSLTQPCTYYYLHPVETWSPP